MVSDCTLDLSRGQLTVFPGKVDAYLAFQAEQRLNAERTNADVLAKRRQLEDFIARNKARPVPFAACSCPSPALLIDSSEGRRDPPVPRRLPPRRVLPRHAAPIGKSAPSCHW
ncbi:hypothetical protein EBR04_02900 [bacterium]|nr:hypothetical protein [bacterium]